MHSLLGNPHEALDRMERATRFVLNSGLDLEAILSLVCTRCGGITTRPAHRVGCPKEED